MTRQATPPKRSFMPWHWPLPGQYALAFLVVAAAIVGRWLLDDTIGNRVPFLLLFGALLPLVQLVRLAPFVVAGLAGWIVSVYLFQPVRMSFVFESSVDVITSVIFAFIFLFAAFTAWLTHLGRDRHEQSQVALAESEGARAHLAAIVASSHDAIISKTLDGMITSWNSSAERLFGYSAQEAIGKSVVMLVPDERVEEEAGILERLRLGERIENFETTRRRKDGSLINVALTVSPVRNSSGEIVGGSKTARDITARKRTEQALLDADRRKDEFLATLAHELRNPLAAISMGMYVLDRAGADLARVSEMSALIHRQLAQLNRLIDDLMDLERISLGKIKLDLLPIELDAIVPQAIKDAQAMCEEHGLELIVELPEPGLPPVTVRADPRRITQVLNNLLHNACKFTHRGGSIRVVLESTATRSEIHVIDTGVGIPLEHLDRIFEMFTQLEKPAGGLGIGLSLARSIVELHGGTLEAHSEGWGHGSEFVISLPCVDAAQPLPAEPRPTPRAEPVLARRIVAADDNADALRAVSLALRMQGHQVHTAENGLEAIDLIRLHKPQVALLDIGMPGIDGYEVARQIREQAWGQKMLLIAMTGWGQKSDKRQAYYAGFDVHLTKPVDLLQLQEYIAEQTQLQQG